jgi:hypothetical protein
MKAHDGDRDRRDDVQDGERTDAANAIGDGAADRPHQRSREHAGRGEIAGGHGIEPVVDVEIDRERGGKADEATEGDGVEEHEPPGIADAQDGEIFHPPFWRRRGRAVLGVDDVDDEGGEQRDEREAEHVDPAERHGEARSEQRRQHRPRIACAGDTKRGALMLGWIPPRRQRQRHRERCAGNAED